jgi:5-methylcytosine-specific restriction endonuclease McrA
LEKEFYKITNGIDKRKREDQSHRFWNNYNEYLNSPEWKEKREIVFKRDNNKCQSCLNKDATQVHHKDGQFRMNEPLFTLVSVCDKCHEIITQIERRNKNVERITHG